MFTDIPLSSFLFPSVRFSPTLTLAIRYSRRGVVFCENLQTPTCQFLALDGIGILNGGGPFGFVVSPSFLLCG